MDLFQDALDHMPSSFDSEENRRSNIIGNITALDTLIKDIPDMVASPA